MAPQIRTNYFAGFLALRKALTPTHIWRPTKFAIPANDGEAAMNRIGAAGDLFPALSCFSPSATDHHLVV